MCIHFCPKEKCEWIVCYCVASPILFCPDCSHIIDRGRELGGKKGKTEKRKRKKERKERKEVRRKKKDFILRDIQPNRVKRHSTNFLWKERRNKEKERNPFDWRKWNFIIHPCLMRRSLSILKRILTNHSGIGAPRRQKVASSFLKTQRFPRIPRSNPGVCHNTDLCVSSHDSNYVFPINFLCFRLIQPHFPQSSLSVNVDDRLLPVVWWMLFRPWWRYQPSQMTAGVKYRVTNSESRRP